jgi:HK97 family phage major capsid protein
VAVGTTTDPTFAKPLVEYQTMADEFLELMRPESIIGQINGFRAVPFNIRIPRQIAGATANWVGEGKSKPVSKPGFDAITMPSAKVAVIVVITEELARDSRPSAEALCRNDMVAAINSFINSEFINPLNAGTAGLSPASITNQGQAVPSTGATVAAVMTDVGTMLTNMANQQISGAKYWIMNPRTFINLSMLRTAQDVYAFPELAGNMFRGYPVVQSTAVPIDGTSKTIIVLMAPNDVLQPDDGAVSLDTSTEASLQMDSAPTSPPTAPLVSLWQQNLLGIRAERGIFWMLRHQAAVQVMTGVTY